MSYYDSKGNKISERRWGSMDTDSFPPEHYEELPETGGPGAIFGGLLFAFLLGVAIFAVGVCVGKGVF